MKNLLFLVFLISTQVYSQSKRTSYLDQDFNKISFKKYKKKLNSKLYFVSAFETDSIAYKKLRLIESFGSLGKKKKSQLNKLYYKRYNIDTTKIWYIVYTDTLPNIMKFPYKTRDMYVTTTKGKPHKIVNVSDEPSQAIDKNLKQEKVIAYSYKDHISKIKDFINSLSEFKDVKVLYFYDFNDGFPVKNSKIGMFEDFNSILKRTFSDGMKTYELIIIHPSGDYYFNSLKKMDLSFKKYSDKNRILDFKEFKKAKKQFIRAYKKVN